MLTLKFVFSIILLVLGTWLFRNALAGVLSAKIRHSDSSSMTFRTKEPVKFWIIVFVQILFGMILVTPLVTLFVNFIAG